MKVGYISAEVRAVVSAGAALIDSDRSDEEIRDEIREAAHGDERLLAKAARHVRLLDEEVDWYGSDRTKRVFDAAARHFGRGPGPGDGRNVQAREGS